MKIKFMADKIDQVFIEAMKAKLAAEERIEKAQQTKVRRERAIEGCDFYGKEYGYCKGQKNMPECDFVNDGICPYGFGTPAVILYCIKCGDRYLQSIETNECYAKNAVAPTMGNRHIYSEFKTVWGNDAKYFEGKTLANNIKVLCSEYGSGDRLAQSIEIKIKEV